MSSQRSMRGSPGGSSGAKRNVAREAPEGLAAILPDLQKDRQEAANYSVASENWFGRNSVDCFGNALLALLEFAMTPDAVEESSYLRAWKAFRTPTGQRWLFLIVTFFLVTGIGAVLLRVLRQHPEPVHNYLKSGPEWLRWIVAFLSTLGVAFLVFRLLNPKWAHKRFFWSFPPGWVAWIAALLVIAVIDLGGGLGADGYQASFWEWVIYPTGAIALIAFHRWLTADDDALEKKQQGQVEEKQGESRAANAITLETLPDNWNVFEKWLKDDSPADEDFIGNKQVALRLASHLITRGGTVGLVGPFGSGKTSIVEWLKKHVDEVQHTKYPDDPEVWFCEVSCWGFEDTSAAITKILSEAIKTVGENVDCFSIRHLPETYRKTFSAAGDWVRTLFDIILGSSDPLVQFHSLSDILAAVDARLVIIIEDLDRTSSSKFDQKEMAALLYRLKRTDHVSFVLAAGRASSGGIDFAKLCGTIELVRSFEPEQIATVIGALREYCRTRFKHQQSYSTESPWNRRFHLFAMYHPEYITPGQAAARLLNTPRGLKQSLSHTYRAWEALNGEIDLDHLLAVNILRHAAPEAFDFLLRNREKFNEEPGKSFDGKDHMPELRARYQAEWTKAVEGVEWDTEAAFALISFLLPNSGCYVREGKSHHPKAVQGVSYKWYWERAVNLWIDPDRPRDQVVMGNISEWLERKNPEAPLIAGLSKDNAYVRVFGHFAGFAFMRKPQDALDLGSQLFDTLRKTPESLIVDDKPPSALHAFWQLTRQIEPADEAAARAWLEGQIAASLPVSLGFANEIYAYWTARGSSMLLPEKVQEIRKGAVDAAKKSWISPEAFVRTLDRNKPYDVYRFVFPPTEREYGGSFIDVKEFAWFGNLLVDSLAVQPEFVAKKIAQLIAARLDGERPGEWVYETDHQILFAIFGNDSCRILKEIERLSQGANEEDRAIFAQIASTGQDRLYEACGLFDPNGAKL